METLFLLGRTVRLHWEHPPPFQENLGSTKTTTTATTTTATTLFTTPEAVVRVTNGQGCNSSSSSSPIRRAKKAMGMLLLLCKITMIVRRSRQTKTTGACQKTTFGTPPSPQNGTTATAAPPLPINPWIRNPGNHSHQLLLQQLQQQQLQRKSKTTTKALLSRQTHPQRQRVRETLAQFLSETCRGMNRLWYKSRHRSTTNGPLWRTYRAPPRAPNRNFG